MRFLSSLTAYSLIQKTSLTLLKTKLARAKLNQFNSLRIWPRFAFGSAAAVAVSGAADGGPTLDTGSTRPRWRFCGPNRGAGGRTPIGRIVCVRT